MKGEQSLPFLLASHLSDFAWGFQSVPPGTTQATQMREAAYVGRATSKLEKVMEINSRQLCAQLWPVTLPTEDVGLELPNLAIFKEKIEI